MVFIDKTYYFTTNERINLMNYGKSIRLFLIEGTADGRWMCELSNWTGKAYKIPRKCVKESADREELKTQAYTFYLENRTNQIPTEYT